MLETCHIDTQILRSGNLVNGALPENDQVVDIRYLNYVGNNHYQALIPSLVTSAEILADLSIPTIDGPSDFYIDPTFSLSDSILVGSFSLFW